MFTGLIEHVGALEALAPQPGGEARLRIDLGPLAEGTKPGDSIAVDGCCLTVVSLAGTRAEFDAVPETLRRTTLDGLTPGGRVNLERALLPHQRLGGHFVQGHVDGTAQVAKTVTGGRWAEWHFALEQPELALQIVEKGSIALDGISLTVAGTDGKGAFWVALIPETLARTTLGAKRDGARVNVETDLLGKYVLAILARRGIAVDAPQGSVITEAWLRERGY
ncbi:MAG: riboflavin synthase [Planctomycetota bacterium]|nr:riboflavin synthase [Planctomycetota bacterium]